MPAAASMALTLPCRGQSNSTPYTQPLPFSDRLTFTVFARIACFESAFCALSAMVIEPVTAVHTVADRYDESFIIVLCSGSAVVEILLVQDLVTVYSGAALGDSVGFRRAKNYFFAIFCKDS